MSMVPLGGIVGSAAGAPLSQTAGSETEAAKKDATAQSRKAEADHKAEQASGIGQTEQDEGTSDRDADGRRLWEGPQDQGDAKDDQQQPSQAEPPRQSKDPSGISGSTLDLTG